MCSYAGGRLELGMQSELGFRKGAYTTIQFPIEQLGLKPSSLKATTRNKLDWATSPPTLCPGQGPAPVDATSAPVDETVSAEEESDERTWLDAAWEVAVTVIGAVVVAAGAACGAFACRRTRALHRRNEESTTNVDEGELQEQRPF